MTIEFLKINHQFHEVKVTRKNAATSRVRLETKTYFLHDICHFFVEKELNYKNGFWGMLAQGYDFTELSGKENVMTEELRFIEQIVGPVQMMVSGHINSTYFKEVPEYLDTKLLENFSVEEVVDKIKECLLQWNKLSFGQSLSLQFEVG